MTSPQTIEEEPSATASPGREYSGALGVLGCVVAVLLCEALVFRYLFQYGLSNVAAIDGASQHIPALLYFHEWMNALLHGRPAGYGMWSWRLGLGSDVLTTLSYYIADPFNFLAVPFPAHWLEYVYEALYFFRVLCAGLAGYAYLRTMRAKQFAAIAGSLVYVFSGYLLILTIRHPYFVDPMVWFPLILIGIEQVLAGKRWYLLVGALTIAAVSNFYFFYQLAIIAVVYAIARWAEVTKPGERMRKLVPDGLRIAGWFLLAILLAAWMLGPLALAVFASSRGNSHYAPRLFFEARTYLTYIVALLSAHGGANAFSGGFAGLGVLSAAVVFLRRGNTALKAMLVAYALAAASPLVSLAVNAFSFPSYRFLFTLGLFLGAAVGIVLSDPRPLSRRELLVTGIGLAVFSALDMWADKRLGYRFLLVLVPLWIAWISWAAFLAERLIADSAWARSDEQPRRAQNISAILRAGLVALIVAGIAINAVAFLDKRFSPALKSFLRAGTVYARYQNDPGSLVSSTLPFEGLQRVDKQRGVLGNGFGPMQNNDPLAQGFAGLDFYYSLMADGVNQYSKALSDRGKRLAFDIEGFDDRAALDTLNAVRYYIAPKEAAAYVPYGFVPTSQLASQTVYENRYDLPVGYVYHSVVGSDTYAALEPVDKQEALLQGVVVGDTQAPTVPRIQPAKQTVEVTYTLTPGSRLTWDQASHTITINQKSATADLAFAPVKDAELYVQLAGITYQGGQQVAMGAKADAPQKSHWIMSATRGYYWGDKTLLINLGYLPNGATHLRLGFADKAKVHYSSLKVIAVPMASYAGEIRKLQSDELRNVRLGTDSLSGSVTSHGDGVLFLSIPYTKGWSAKVDGASAPIIQANDGFSAIPVSSGTHSVELRYVTPGLRAGALVTLVGLLVAIGLAILFETRRRKACAHGEQPLADASPDRTAENDA